MLIKALDFLRTIGWGIISFIYDLIDTLFEILRELNAYNIIDSVAGNSMFSNFHKGIIAVAITLLGLFVLFKFVMKIIEPEEGPSTQQLVTEIIKSTLFVLLSVFLFAEVSTFSIKLSGFTSNIFNSNNMTISDSMLTMYVDYTEQYKVSDEFLAEDYSSFIQNDSFTNGKIYNDKFITNERWILSDEKDYKYSINWIMSILIGGFFLYALFFSGMMLARRQIEFLFLFVISPVVFATSVGNKQRRSAVIEQLVSLMLQGAVVMLIINLTAIVANAIDSTTFFANNDFKEIVIKSLMYIGAGTFLLTGSQVVNRFIGGNVSANSGREQLMSLMGFGHALNTATSVATGSGFGASMFGVGIASGVIGRVGGNAAVKKIGGAISNFGAKITGKANNPKSALGRIGNFISNTGSRIGQATPSNIGRNLRHRGVSNVKGSINTLMPQRNMYRNRYRER
ncbi:MAG: hypothetical protein Q4G05_01685 [Clostridia bacterium]|nr:hypothetical protein [Clostridia bacterium]